jgi:hypothetical protein
MRRASLLAALVLVLPLAFAEEFDDVVKRTDMTSADSVYELAQWCDKNGKAAQARKYYNDIISKIDKDHEPARTALGFVRVGDRWVNKAFVPAGTGAKGQDATVAGGRRVASGKGPTAAEVQWPLDPPKDPAPDNKWLDQYIQTLNRAGNDSDQMDAAINTILREDNWAIGLPRICAALTQASFTDLYGGAEMVRRLWAGGRKEDARRIYAFVAKASERNRERGDLEMFCMVSEEIRDKRAVPRLMELLKDDKVQTSAASALSAITKLPAKGLTAEAVQGWWDLNWNVSEEQILREQLRDADPMVRVAACEGLYEKRDRAIMPVLIALLRLDNRAANNRAINLINKIGGQRIYDPSMPPEEKKKKVDMIEKWWKEDGARWQWMEDRIAANTGTEKPAEKKDANAALVAQLTSVAGREAADAESRLVANGAAAIPALLDGLDSKDGRLRRKCNDVIKQISKQDFGFDPQADDAMRGAAVKKWRDWAAEQAEAAPAPDK